MVEAFYNTFTLVYKLAAEKKIPARYVYSRGSKDGKVLVLNAREEIVELFEQGYKIVDCYDMYRKVVKFSVADLAFVYLSWNNRAESLTTMNNFIDMMNRRLKLNQHHPFELDANREVMGFAEWQESENKEAAEDAETFERHHNFLTNFSNLDIGNYNPNFTKVEIKSATYHYYLYRNDRRLESNDGFNIFNLSQANENIPIIQWLGEKAPIRYKVYELLDYNSLDTKTNDNPNSLLIYFFVEHEKSKKKFFYPGELDLTTSVLTISLPKKLNNIDIPAFFEEQLVASLGVTIKSVDVRNVKGDFLMTPIPNGLNENIFQFVIMTEPFFRNFYFNEVTQTRLEKDKQPLNFRSFRGTKSYYASSYLSTSFTTRVVFEGNVDYRGSSYQKLTIRKSNNLEEIGTFLSFFQVLVGFYLLNGTQEPIKELFIKYIYEPVYGDKTESVLSSLNTARARHLFVPTTKIQLLKQMNPEMFSYNNARVTNCEKQPIIIREEDVEDWQNLLVEGEERQVIKFPPTGENSFWYVCPDDNFPYMSFSRNRIPSKNTPTEEHFLHLQKYPYTPQCKKDYHELGDLGQYTQAVDEEETVVKKTVSAHETLTFKIRRFGQIGRLLPTLTNFFSLLYPQIKSMGQQDKLRPRFMGVDVSENSFLQAVMLAISFDPNQTNIEYQNSDDPEERLSEVADFRRAIAEDIKPETYKQELYDMPLSVISSKVGGKDYFDSSLYYRGVEEFFNCNIIVFRPEVLRKGIKTSVNPNVVLEIPRHREYYIRGFNINRQTIFLYKSLGSESDNVKFPHYHLIVNIETNPKINEKVFAFIEKAYKAYLWTYQQEKRFTTSQSFSRLRCRLNPSDYLQWVNILRDYSLHSQYIDGYGKCRAITIIVGEQKVTLAVLPSAPLELKHSEKIYRTTKERALALFGEPSGVNINGYWFQVLDYRFGLFVPIEDIEEDEVTPCPQSFLSLGLNEESRYNKYVQFKRSSKVLIDMIEWVWRHDYRSTLEEWWEKHVDTSRNTSTSLAVWSEMNIFFPSVRDSTEEAIEAISKWWPEIFDEKIYLSPELSFRLYAYFRQLQRDTDGLDNNPPHYVKSLIESDLVTSATEGNIMFVGYNNFNKWLDLKQKIHTNNITEEINISSAGSEPFIYRDLQSQKIYMIQKLANPSKQNAVMLCQIWITEGRNAGFEFDDPELTNSDDLPASVVYQIGDQENLEVVEDFSYGHSEYHGIILYNGTQYASLLPLL